MIKKYKKLLLMMGLIILFGVGQLIYRTGYFDFHTIKVQKDYLKSFVLYNTPLAVLSFILFYMASVIMMLPIGIPLSVMGGFLFGTIPALCFVVVATTLGTVCLIAIARLFFKESIRIKHTGPIELLNRMLKQYGIFYLLCIRLFFMIPSSLVNTTLALTSVPLRTIGWTTAIGIVPVMLIFCSAGNKLDKIQSLTDILTWKVALIFGILGFLVLLPVFLKQVGFIKRP